MTIRLRWNPEATPRELHSLLDELGTSYPIRRSGAGVRVSFMRSSEAGLCEVKVEGRSAEIVYGSVAQAARGVGALLAGLSSSRTSTPFKSLGIMLDCSRNAVMTVEHLQVWLRRLALLGYNMVMLYTEDTYELPGEPYFGYQRGAYTADELRVIDDYAARLGIEIVPCIQTLGHLEQILRHGAYHDIKDTSTVMMVGQKKTYALIEKMLKHWKSVCRTRRIHIGMDETHDLGRGRYLDLYGYKHGFELFNQHLGEVARLCRKHGLHPMIWSDMYFRLGSKRNDYYDRQSVIPPKVVKKIPRDVELVYWDYYHDNEEFYVEWIRRHRALGKEPLMGSGIWTWSRYWYDHQQTMRTAGPCIDACYQEKIDEIFYTQWGDNGAYCDHDSAFAGMAYCAEKSYGIREPSDSVLEKRFAAVCGGSYRAHLLASKIHAIPAASERDPWKGFWPNMWDDPIFETHVRTTANDSVAQIRKVAAKYEKLAAQLKPHTKDRATGDLLHAHRIARAFAVRYAFCADLQAAYRKRDRKALAGLVRRIPAVCKDISAMADSFRGMWMRHNKPEGIKAIQDRFGMLDARYAELAQRLRELLRGEIERIDELDHRCPPA